MLPLLRPKYWSGHLVMLLCVAAAVGLGLWQLHAWRAHRAAAAVNLTHAKAVPLGSVMTGDSAFPGRSVGQPVTFSGTWLPKGSVYVEDRYLGKKKGYWVVTPVLIGHGKNASAMPVVRGWSPTTDVTAPTGTTTVTGWLQPSEDTGIPDPDPEDDILPEVRVASMLQHVDADLYGGYVVARDSSTPRDGLRAVGPDDVPPVSGFTALRNLLYAIEWWFFGGFAVFIWWRWCRDQLLPVTEEQVVSSP